MTHEQDVLELGERVADAMTQGGGEVARTHRISVEVTEVGGKKSRRQMTETGDTWVAAFDKIKRQLNADPGLKSWKFLGVVR